MRGARPAMRQGLPRHAAGDFHALV